LKTAVEWFTLAAEQGDADSQYNLGQMYREGKVLPQNDKTALSWFARSWYTKAAEQGHSKAQYNLGTMYSQGDGVSVCNKTAAKWYNLAAEQSHDGPQY
jgi:TPR repeat protein